MSDINYLTKYLNPRKHQRDTPGKNEYYFVRIDKTYIEQDQFAGSDDVIKILRGNFRVDPFGPFLEIPSSFSQMSLYVELNNQEITYFFKKEINGNVKYLTLEKIVKGYNSDNDYEEFNDQNFIFIQQSEGLVYHKGQKKLYSIHIKLREIVVVSKRTLTYNPNELGGLKSGRHKLDFKDATGYTNRFWDQLILNLSKGSGGIGFPPERKRVIDLKLNSQKGELYWYPRYELIDKDSVKLTYDYYSKENSEEAYAIELTFKHPEAFLAFMNLTYFNNGISPFGVHDDSGFRKVYLLHSYVSFINIQLNRNRPSLKKALTYIYYIPQDFFIKTQNLYTEMEDPNNILGKEFLWKVLSIALEGTISNRGVNKEDIVIKILYILKAIQDYVEEGKEITKKERTDRYDYLLTKLLNTKTSKQQSFLIAMYHKLNTDDFVAYNTFIYSLWVNSSYINPEHPVYKKTSQIIKEGEETPENTPQLLLPYKTDKLLGFYSSNMNIDFKNENIVVTPDESSIGNTLRTSNALLATIVDLFTAPDWESEYHPLQPVFLLNPHKSKAIELQALSPMLLLKANEDKSFWSNVATTSEYAFDILTTFSGIGNLAKFRQLGRIVNTAQKLNKSDNFIDTYKFFKGVKGFAAGVEISVGPTNILLKATGVNDSEFGRALGEYLIWLEIIALSGEGLASAINGIRKASRKMLQNPDLIINIEKNSLKGLSDAAIKNLSQGAQEALSVLKELLVHAQTLIEQSWKQIKYIGKRVADDLESLGAQVYKVGEQSEALLKFLFGNDPVALEFALANSSKIDNVVVYNGKPIFHGSKAQFDAFAKKLNDAHKSGIGKGGRTGGKASLKNHLDELVENLTLKNEEFLKKNNLAIRKTNSRRKSRNLELVDVKSGDVIIRNTHLNIEKVIKFLKMPTKQREKLINEVNKLIKQNNAKAYKEGKSNKKLKEIGITTFIPTYKKGAKVTPDFSPLNLDMFLKNGKLGNGFYESAIENGATLREINQILEKMKSIKGEITVNVTSNRSADFSNIWRALGLTPVSRYQKIIEDLDISWHHLDNLNIDLKSTFQLVHSDIHGKTTQHMGSHKQMEILLSLINLN